MSWNVRPSLRPLHVPGHTPLTVSPASPRVLWENLKRAEADPGPNAGLSACRVVREGTVNGEAATLYSSHTESKNGKTESQTWISKSRGLPLKVETDVDAGAAGKSRRESRFEYTNVTAPAGVK